MSMDLSQIKNRLDSFTNKGAKYEKVDYSKVYFKPKVGSYQVRIVPSKFNKSTPFREIYFHYNFAKYPILALTNWGEADPIVETSQKLRKSTEAEHWAMAKKIYPKMRIFAPVIVRGEEAAGVRLWEFGREIYTFLLNIAMNEDYGDYTDIQDGRDFAVEVTEDIVMGRKGIKCALTPRVKTTPLSADAALVKLWLEEQPDVLSLYKKPTYEELEEIFHKWANPEDDEEAVPVSETAEEEIEQVAVNVDVDGLPWTEVPAEKPRANFALNVDPKAKPKLKADKFQDLFNEEK